MLFKVLRVVIILSAVGIASVLLFRVVLAHGAMQTPMSRVYSCYLENPETPDTLACKDAIAMGGTQPLYDWNEVNLRNAGGNHRTIIPDGKLCSAGRDKYAAFDQPRLDWPVTILPASGTYTFYFTAAVPHNMGHFELYVTRNGYDPLQPLKWSDLDPTPFLVVQEPPVINGYYVFSGALPAGKSGRHLVYTIWQRHDSQEAFYSCSDVWFGTSPTPQPTNPPMCTAPDWSSSVVYQLNDVVNHNGKQWRAKWSNTSAEPSSDGGVSPWEIQGYCQRGGGVTPTFTPTGVTVTPTFTHTSTPTAVTNTPTITNTPGTPTVTRTPTFTATVNPSVLKLQYRAADTNAGDNQIKPHFNIVNTGTSPVPLSELTIRYWFTREGTANQNFWCDWSAISGGCSSLSGTFVQVSPARTGANFYLQVSFAPAAGSIPAGGQSGEIQARFAKTDWSNYTETGDYSFDPSKLSFTDWTHVTLYRNGVLIWGTEP